MSVIHKPRLQKKFDPGMGIGRNLEQEIKLEVGVEVFDNYNIAKILMNTYLESAFCSIGLAKSLGLTDDEFLNGWYNCLLPLAQKIEKGKILDTLELNSLFLKSIESYLESLKPSTLESCPSIIAINPSKNQVSNVVKKLREWLTRVL
jgi:hypothetical protein